MPALRKNDSEDHGAGRSSRHGLYSYHLERWFQLFDRGQILVLSYDELSNNPAMLQNRIQQFICRSIEGKLTRSNSNDSKHKVRESSNQARRMLLSIFTDENRKLYSLLKENPGPAMEQMPFPPFT